MTLYHKKMGSGPDLVLLHGWGFHSEVWGDLAEAWSQDFCVHLIDLPGFGRSDSLVFPEKKEEVLSSLLPTLPEQAIYFAWSLGGLIAQSLALAFPQRVRALLTLSASPCFLQTENWQGVEVKFFNDFYHCVANYPEKARQQFFLLGVAGQRKLCYELKKQYSWSSTRSLLNGLKVLKDTDLREKLKEITCPTAYYITQNDPLAPFNVSMPYKILPVNGHAPIITHPKMVKTIGWKFIYESKLTT